MKVIRIYNRKDTEHSESEIKKLARRISCGAVSAGLYQ